MSGRGDHLTLCTLIYYSRKISGFHHTLRISSQTVEIINQACAVTATSLALTACFLASKQYSSWISPYLPYFLTQGRNPERRLPWSMTRFGAGTGLWSALAWTAAGSWRGPAPPRLRTASPSSQWERKRRAGPSKGEALAGRNRAGRLFHAISFGSRRVAGGVSHSPIRASWRGFPSDCTWAAGPTPLGGTGILPVQHRLEGGTTPDLVLRLQFVGKRR